MRPSLKRIIFTVTSGLGFVVPSLVLAAKRIDEISYTLEQPFGNVSTVTSFGQYLQLAYEYTAGLIGIIAVVVIMAGGLMWVSAAGNEQKISTAKEIIIGAVTAVVIIVLSYAILVFINPRLVQNTFSLERISFVPSDVDINTLPLCTSKNFTGQTCVGEDSRDIECDLLQCGEIGTLPSVGECRGAGNECGSGSYKCYPDSDIPREDMQCQLDACGTWISSCYQKYMKGAADETNETAYNNCICQYYESEAMDYFGGVNAYDATRAGIFEDMCNETIENIDWSTYIGNDSAIAAKYTGATTGQASVLGLNCGLGCNFEKGEETYRDTDEFGVTITTTLDTVTCVP